ncbi:MAG: LamG domain-containing protein, partial [Armatimonadetes bacterium]|nr:LamG domain-containing protein [Armatimonadota bacterium]
MPAIATVLAMAVLAQPADTLLYLPLDGTTSPARGQGPVKVEGRASFQPGVVGQALVCGEGGAQLQIRRQGNVNPAAGTVSLWVKPLDWKPDDGKFHVFFEGKGPGWLLVYKYYSAPARVLLLLSDNVKEHGWQLVAGKIEDWQPGQWHHVAAAWDLRQARLYLDGKLVSTMDHPPVPAVESETFNLGDAPWHIKRQAQSLLDEVYVFSRPLTDDEIAALYQAGREGKLAPEQLAPVPPMRVFLLPQGWRNKYVVMVDLSGLGPQERARVAVRGELVSPARKATWKGPVSPVVGHIAKIEVPLHFEPAGPWTFRATAALDGRQV